MTARDHALLQLDARRLPGWPSDLVNRRGRSSRPADPRDLALGEQIVTGVIKNLILLEFHTAHYSGKPLARIDPLIRKILAIALYQLAFLDRVPASAATDEAVKQARKFGRARAAGFVNAVLRNVTRQDPPTLPDVTTDPSECAHIALSHPPQLVRRLEQLLGIERAVAFCRHDNAEPPTLVRLLAGADPAALVSAGVEAIPHERPGIMVVRGARQPLLAQWADEGIAQVQDATAAAVVDHLFIAPGHSVMDRCAGLGTKTLQLLEKVGETGNVVAVDSSASRCQTLRRIIDRRQIRNVQVFQAERLDALASQIPAVFDRILLDVPCSNSGVLARRPEARFASLSESLLKSQRDLLDDTAPRIGPEGLLAYSTCSIWSEENDAQIRLFLDRNPDFDRVEQVSTLPSFDTTDPQRYHDGGYVAVLRRRKR